ncbi:MAG: cell division protein FtsL [Acidobacteria bacterium]|nr:cell division protein FtsL [Acidobacteriota bacterium]
MREIYYVKSIDNSRLAPVMDPRAPKQYASILMLAAAIFAVILFSSWQRYTGVADGYKLETLQKQKQDMLESNRKLRLEEASLVNPVRIDTIARNDLQMSPLAPAQIIREMAPTANDLSVTAEARKPVGPLAYQMKNVAAAVP